MSEYYPYIIPGIIFLIVGYFIINFIFDLLLRGFCPLIPSRPWVVEQIMRELELSGEITKMIALSSGRSGFFHALEKKYPNIEMIGIEPRLFPYLVAFVQGIIRRSKIKMRYQKAHRVDVSNAEFIYNHLYPPDMEGLGKKLKFECQPGTIVVSTGFNIAYLLPKKVISLPDLSGRFGFLSRNQRFFQRKNTKYKKEKKAYFYEI